ncbi:MAG TPA: hypothetical protein PKD59_09575 [Miltoncostaeaceae bacterium]|nr:hypothetical protein [Miltoncostaeaceae bacterium]
MGTEDVQQRREMAARQRAMAVQLGRAGVAQEVISARTGLTKSAIRRALARETKDVSSQADERLALHVDALMELWRALYPAASAGDLASIDRFLQIERRVGDLIGLGRGGDASALPPGEDEGLPSAERRFARTSPG